MSTIVRERIEMRVDVETKQLAERAAAALGCSSLTEFLVRLIRDKAPQILQEQANIELSNAQFDRFIEVCNAQYTVPTRLKQAAQLLDKEGF
ncbi:MULTISPECIES: DUF1778 domain-containing protein [Acinetobacter]|uniref:type II toxin-antitoxin system TacA family antitoxin n=1 Tax=Acinetobacter TaxID=469 RepID=UPI001022F1C3|nr:MULTISPECIES: DUF1778 domain-containing protein [Acinetobacter]RZG70311.1 DUF1778 domain-containing protein [Acinetobacter wuhouensis]